MPAIIALLLRGGAWLVGTYAGQWILKAALSLGIGIVVHKVALPELLAYIQARAANLSPFYFQVFGAIGGDVFMSMILSATIAAVSGNIALKALTK